MKYLKHTGFLEPYVLAADGIVQISKLARLKAFKVPLSKEPRTDGMCTDLGNGKYEITLALWRRNAKKTRHEPAYWESVLFYLAHELAHLAPGYWEHPPKHFEIQAKILKKFAKVAEEQGIEDVYDRIPIK